jgi:uncharacterized protein YjbJ (UPF0337 family)
MNTHEAKDRAKDAIHSGKVDKAKGHAKEVIGAAKEKVGSFIGDAELEAKGRLQNADGKKDRLKGEIKEKIEDVKDTVKAGVELIKEKVRDDKRR